LFLLYEVLSDGSWRRQNEVRQFGVDKKYGIGARLDGAIKLLIWLGLAEPHQKEIRLTSAGKQISNIAQGELLGRTELFGYFFQSAKRDGVLGIIFPNLRRFGGKGNKFVGFSTASVPLKFLPLLHWLKAAGFLQPNRQFPALSLVSPSLAEWFVAHIPMDIESEAVSGGLGLKKFKELQELRAKLGESAEVFVLGLEKKRLAQHPNLPLVRRVSIISVDAGYDIRSFDNESSVCCDRFIEVKSVGECSHIFWSSNEVKAARRLANSYYLCIVERAQLSNTQYQPLFIRNPYRLFFSEMPEVHSGDGWVVEPDGWRISFQSVSQLI
jgi:hypothetical protein